MLCSAHIVAFLNKVRHGLSGGAEASAASAYIHIKFMPLLECVWLSPTICNEACNCFCFIFVGGPCIAKLCIVCVHHSWLCSIIPKTDPLQVAAEHRVKAYNLKSCGRAKRNRTGQIVTASPLRLTPLAAAHRDKIFKRKSCGSLKRNRTGQSENGRRNPAAGIVAPQASMPWLMLAWVLLFRCSPSCKHKGTKLQCCLFTRSRLTSVMVA